MGVSFRRLIANLKRNNYSASISRTDGLLNFKFQDTFKKQLKTKAKVKNRTLLSHWPTTTLDIDDSIRGHRRWRGEKGRGGSLATSPPPPLNKEKGGSAPTFWCRKITFTGAFDIPLTLPVTSATSFRSHIFCPQTTQQLPWEAPQSRTTWTTDWCIGQIRVVTVMI